MNNLATSAFNCQSYTIFVVSAPAKPLHNAQTGGAFHLIWYIIWLILLIFQTIHQGFAN